MDARHKWIAAKASCIFVAVQKNYLCGLLSFFVSPLSDTTKAISHTERLFADAVVSYVQLAEAYDMSSADVEKSLL